MNFDSEAQTPADVGFSASIDTIGSDDLCKGRQAARLLLGMTGENLSREGLRETPTRVAKAYEFLLSGYRLTPREAIGEGIFPSEGNGLVAVQNVEYFSLCEHHLLPFWGYISVAYYPNTSILGLSKIPRLVNLYARRVQVQERLTRQICDAMVELIAPRAVMVRAQGCHMCMMMRGVEKQASSTLTEAGFGLENLRDYEREQILKLDVRHPS